MKPRASRHPGSKTLRLWLCAVVLAAPACASDSDGAGSGGDPSAGESPAPAAVSRAPFDPELRAVAVSELLFPPQRIDVRKQVRVADTACFLASIRYRGERSRFARCLEREEGRWVAGPPIGELFTATPERGEAAFTRPERPALARWIVMGNAEHQFIIGLVAPVIAEIEALSASGEFVDRDVPAGGGETVVSIQTADVVVMRDEQDRVAGLSVVRDERPADRSSEGADTARRFVEAVVAGDASAASDVAEASLSEGQALPLLIGEVAGAELGATRPDPDGRGFYFGLVAKSWRGSLLIHTTREKKAVVWGYTFSRRWHAS